MGRITNKSLESFDFINLNNMCVTMAVGESLETPILTTTAHNNLLATKDILLEGGFDIVKLNLVGFTVIDRVEYPVQVTGKELPVAEKVKIDLSNKDNLVDFLTKKPAKSVSEDTPIAEEPVTEESVTEEPTEESIVTEDIFAKYNKDNETAFINALKADYSRDELAELCIERSLDSEGTKGEMARKLFDWYIAQ